MSGFWFGQPYAAAVNSAPTFTNHLTMNTAGHKSAWTFRAPKTGTLNRFGYRIGTVGNVPDNGLRYSFQSLSAGLPDGTQDQFADITSGIATGAWLEPTDYMGSGGLGSGSKRSVTIGEYLSAVIEFPSFVAGDSVTTVRFGITDDLSANQNPLVNTGAGYTATNNNGWPLGLLYDGDSDYTPFLGDHWVPFATFVADAAYGSGSTPDERGMRFQLPWDCIVDGVEISADWDADADIVIYDSDGTSVLATVNQDSENRLGTNPGPIKVPFPDVALLANTTYRVTAKPTTASTLQLQTFTASSNAHLGGISGGSSWYYTQRTDGGSWTDTDTKRPWIRFHIKAQDGSPGGSGGGQRSYVF